MGPSYNAECTDRVSNESTDYLSVQYAQKTCKQAVVDHVVIHETKAGETSVDIDFA
jgi:hypothetical protein